MEKEKRQKWNLIKNLGLSGVWKWKTPRKRNETQEIPIVENQSQESRVCRSKSKIFDNPFSLAGLLEESPTKKPKSKKMKTVRVSKKRQSQNNFRP